MHAHIPPQTRLIQLSQIPFTLTAVMQVCQTSEFPKRLNTLVLTQPNKQSQFRTPGLKNKTSSEWFAETKQGLQIFLFLATDTTPTPLFLQRLRGEAADTRKRDTVLISAGP